MNNFDFQDLVDKITRRFAESGLMTIPEEGKADLIVLLNKDEPTIGAIISALLPIIYLIAGLILFGAIIVSGFQLMTSGGDQKKTAEAKGCLTSAIIGFVIIFVSWWLIQIIQIIFGLPSLLAFDRVFY